MATIRSDQHVFIPGMNGSGKTFLAKTYLAGNEKPVYVLDTKGTFTWEQIPADKQITITTYNDLPKVTGKYRFIIYRPRHEELEIEYYDVFFRFCYELQHVTVYVDEAMQVCPSPSKIPSYYKGILTRGRELDVNIWSATQRPSGIPIIIYSEAYHWFVFKLQNPTDREKLADYSGYGEFMEILPKYEFLYFSAETGNAPINGILKGGQVNNV